MPYFNAYLWRHALSISVAVLIAFVTNYFYSFSHGSWMVLATLLVSQITRGTPLRQGVLALIAICAGLVVGDVLLVVVSDPLLRLSAISLIFIIIGMFFFNETTPIATPLNCASIFFLVCLFTVFSMPGSELGQRVVDVGVGTLIGMACVQLILPPSVVDEFRAGVVPILSALTAMSQTLVSCYAVDQATMNINGARCNVEKVLEQRAYPTWAYEIGFNPGLRAGFRFFLVHLERLIEGMFALSDLVQQPIHLKDEALRVAIHESLQCNHELFVLLEHYFAENTYPVLTHDLTTDIATLENCLQQVVPPQLALLDVSPDYVILTALVRQIKDNRQRLIQLIDTLPRQDVTKQKE